MYQLHKVTEQSNFCAMIYDEFVIFKRNIPKKIRDILLSMNIKYCTRETLLCNFYFVALPNTYLIDMNTFQLHKQTPQYSIYTQCTIINISILPFSWWSKLTLDIGLPSTPSQPPSVHDNLSRGSPG